MSPETAIRPQSGEARRTAGPDVSIVIPCYNHARYLGEAIESALAQTHPHVEVLVVDDGSTDDTAGVAASHPTVRYVHQANQGLAAARNTGLRHSCGRYLIFLDADDRLLPGAAAAALDAFGEHPDSAFVFGTFRWIAADGRVIAEAEASAVEGDRYLALLRRNFIGMHATVAYRRGPMESVGGFDLTLPACEDYDMYLRLAERYEIHGYGGLVAEYRQHGGNMSSDKALIAESALAALRRQWKGVRWDRPRRRAYMEGVSYWVSTYGKGGLWAASEWKLRGEGLRGLRNVGVLARQAPQWFMVQTARRLVRKARQVGHRLRHGEGTGRADIGAPPPGHVRFGDLRRVRPIDPYFGFQRGLPVDRYYIERFLETHTDDVRGRVLEIKDATYTRQFGGDRVLQSDVLDVDPSNPLATVVADLADADAIPGDTYDCVLLTQTLQLVYDVRAALATVHRILKPGGVALVTVPGITKTDGSAPWYWTFTTESARRLFEETFPGAAVTVEGHGNVLAATAFLMGLAAGELTPAELDVEDAEYRVCIAVCAVKGGSA